MNNQAMSLRRRVTLASTALGFLLSLLFSIVVVGITEDFEHVLAAEILGGQAEDYGLRLSNHLPAQLPETHRLRGYRGAAIPARYAGYAPGVSEDEDSAGIHVGIFDTSAGRLAFVIDLSDIERLEHHLNLFLAAMVVLGTLVSGWLGWLFAGASLAPVSRLATAVDALLVTPQATELQATVSRDELGRLAQAIDGYQARLVAADTHEQAFFADASHELRTPIAVVQGATEVLLDEPEPDPARRMRLQRLERGMQELSDLIEAILGIARRSPLQPSPVDAASFLQDASAAVIHSYPGISSDIRAGGLLQLPQREALLLLRGLLRRMLQPATPGILTLQLVGGTLDVQFQARDDAAPAAPAVQHRSDTGRAVALLDRLAQRMGWELVTQTPTHLRIGLPAHAINLDGRQDQGM
ncbi:MAG: HAMP domain-containing sensor histidine kinase [Luteimonas sp.]